MSKELVDDYLRPIDEVNQIITKGNYKYTDQIMKKVEFVPVSSSSGYYKTVIYRMTTGGLWIRQN